MKKPAKKAAKRAAPKKIAKKAATRRKAPAPVMIWEPTVLASNAMKRRAKAAFERVAVPSNAGVTWSRGKLPGDVYIKTNSATREFVVISREEWETLGR